VTETVACGEIDPLAPGVAVIVKDLRLKEAVTDALAFIIKVLVSEVPEQAPDQPAKVELAFGAAVSVTVVPALKLDPVGLLATVPLPVPALIIFRLY
jgi:hypothetical protein